MDTALSEIRAFLSPLVPFDRLPETVLDRLVKALDISYLVSKTALPPTGEQDNRLFIVRKGALSYFGANGDLAGKYGEGDICTLFAHSSSNPQGFSVQTDEDTLLYGIDFSALVEITSEYPQVEEYLRHSAESLLRQSTDSLDEQAVLASSLTNSAIAKFYNGPVADIDANSSIKAAAIKMSERGFSCLMVTQDGQPQGIVTDKDITRRCVAQGLDTNRAISEIMTSAPVTIDIAASAFDALMLMTARHIHHLPVADHGQLVGMVSMTDLINHEGQNAHNISHLIHKAQSVDELTELSRLLPKLQQSMAKLDATAENVGRSISAITKAFTIRLIELAEQQLGSAPVPYAWLAAGSMARQEQLVNSDQDNALLISDSLSAEQQGWFEKLATFVCDGLAACGYIYCPGDVMATNPQWRQTQTVWRGYFKRWIDTPDPKALMHCSIFFDLECVYGEKSLLDDIRAEMLQKTRSSTLFLAHLSHNALNFRPPLGFFRDFVLISGGEHKQTIDIKHFGITPIVDLARIYALAEGIAATNTLERLQLAADSPSLSRSSAASLLDAYRFLTQIRLQHHTNRLRKGEKPDNYLSPKTLSQLERDHLKAAFKVIKTLQEVRQQTL